MGVAEQERRGEAHRGFAHEQSMSGCDDVLRGLASMCMDVHPSPCSLAAHYLHRTRKCSTQPHLFPSFCPHTHHPVLGTARVAPLGVGVEAARLDKQQVAVGETKNKVLVTQVQALQSSSEEERFMS